MPVTFLRLADVVDSVRRGSLLGEPLAEFLEPFDRIENSERLALLSDGPPFLGENRFDALIGAIAEYLAKDFALDRVPAWVSNRKRFLKLPWHLSSLFIDWRREYLTDGMREYLTFASPAEFASRNIFTEERPLRRARGPVTDGQ